MQCEAWTRTARRCKNAAKAGHCLCGPHLAQNIRRRRNRRGAAANQKVTGGRGFRLDNRS